MERNEETEKREESLLSWEAKELSSYPTLSWPCHLQPSHHQPRHHHSCNLQRTHCALILTRVISSDLHSDLTSKILHLHCTDWETESANSIIPVCYNLKI